MKSRSLRSGFPRVFPWRLQTDDVRGLQAFRALLDLEFHRVPFIQRAVAIGLDGGEVDEHVSSRFPLDEAVPLGCVEPLYGSFFLHVVRRLLVEAIWVPESGSN